MGMVSSTAELQGRRALELVFATAGPLSLDEVVAWELARPTDLWRWLEEGRSQGWVAEAAAREEGVFELCDDVRRRELVGAITPDEWRWLAGRDTLVPRLLTTARDYARLGQLKLVSYLFRALVQCARPEAIPGGPLAWIELVVECVRLFRFVDWLDEQILERALTAAVDAGELRLQAILLAACGYVATRAQRMEEGREHLARALEAARALGDRLVLFEVHVQMAYGQVLQGSVHDAIATFERFLGDVPEDLLPLPAELALPFDPLPEMPLAILGAVYGQVGQYGRSLELLHRLRVAGERNHRQELVALAQCFLAVVHTSLRELEPTRAFVEPAFAYWSSHRSAPYLLWRTAISLAWVRMLDGQLDEARAVLEVGQEARLASGLPYFAGSALFEVLERLASEGRGPIAGLDLDQEIERMLAGSDGFMNGVAHRIRARQLARGEGEIDAAGAAMIEGHLQESIRILSASRACASELARSFEDAGRWAARRGRSAEAAQFAARASEILAVIDSRPAHANADPTRVARVLVELGQLTALVDHGAAVWGELAARLCALLGVERCALLEPGEGGNARALGVRGGGNAWVAALERILAEQSFAEPMVLAPPATEAEPTSSTGQLFVVPYVSKRLGRRGWAFLENRHRQAALSTESQSTLAMLAVQLGVLLENVVLWQELAATRQRLEFENRYYRRTSPAPASGGRIVGDSPALRRTLELVGRAAPATTTVLIQGETGVGKELIAREVHRLSPRCEAPFIAVHIGSLTPGLIASALFGHERGAFTGASEQTHGRFELADGGTLLLDEVGELGPEEQVRLLRVLQEGTFERVGGTRQLRSDFRLVAATNRDLAALVKAGRFREDLYYRLAAFPILVPPLRERKEEIPTLSLYFMEVFNRKLARSFEGIGEADMARLLAYRWPGNVRELEHTIERAAILCEPPRLRIPPLQDSFAQDGASSPDAPGDSQSWVSLAELERRYLRRVIAHTGGRITGPSGAAELVDLKPSTLTWRIEKLGLRPELNRARAERK